MIYPTRKKGIIIFGRENIRADNLEKILRQKIEFK